MKYRVRDNVKPGFQSGRFIVESIDGRWALCKCQCGAKRRIDIYQILYGIRKSCGCRNRDLSQHVQDGDGYKLIPLTLGYYTKIDPQDLSKVQGYKWMASYRTYPYACRSATQSERDEGWPCIIKLHRWLLNVKDRRFIDHKNHDTLDNRRDNLRIASAQQNVFNSHAPRTSTRQFKCVYPRNGRWTARVRVNGQQKSLGMFNTQREAVLAYNQAVIKYHGEFAFLNPVPK